MKPAILVPFDFSEAARNALAWAASLQRATGGPPLQIVHVLDPVPSGVGDVVGDNTGPDEEQRRKLEQEIREAARVAGATEPPSISLRAGRLPSEVILDASVEWGADLIVMGTHGRRGFRRMLLGSVAEEVVRRASAPVVTVPGTSSAS